MLLPESSSDIAKRRLSSLLLNKNSTIFVDEPLSSMPMVNITNNNHTVTNNTVNVNCWSDDATSILYQLAYISLLIVYLVPNGKYCLLFIHFILAISNLLLIIWISKICFITVPSLLGWSITFLCVNILRIANELYQTRYIKFNKELEETYNELFAIVGISRESFKRLIHQGKLITLHSGESYATEKITANNRLSLLISGKINVLSKNHFLHSIKPGEFLDSPEWESCCCHSNTIKSLSSSSMLVKSKEIHHSNKINEKTSTSSTTTDNNEEESCHRSIIDDNRFNVSLIAITQCRILCWNRIQLEYYLAKDKQMNKILNILIGRDITNKLYAMNANIISDKGSILDIRLPVIINSMTKQLIDNDGKRIINNNNRQRSQSIHPSPTPRLSSLSSNKIIRSEKDDKRNDNQLIDQQAAIILNDDHQMNSSLSMIDMKATTTTNQNTMKQINQ
ncbi:popeye domain-containing protein 3-like [Dermatophagoides pteronyssinus]|uniref:popeye domain-containing protein 3-like n=1 Tax=Dermatophagoides pteronyssinus TaxID=6956 RepID=UPI003F680D74